MPKFTKDGSSPGHKKEEGKSKKEKWLLSI